MIEPKTPVARIVFKGTEAARILMDKTVEWLSPLTGEFAGHEKAIEDTVSTSTDGLSSSAAVYASITLARIYSGTDLRVELLVPYSFGVEPDVI